MNTVHTESNHSAADEVTLLIFSCEGRGHLLQATLESFRGQCPLVFAETILAYDGIMNPDSVKEARCDRLVQNCGRRGYIHNILNALALVRTPYVFWLEDDWAFDKRIELSDWLFLLHENPDWIQIRFSKTAPLSMPEKASPLGSHGLYQSIYGFSANPCLAKTAHLKNGFAAYEKSPRLASNTFEPFLEKWANESGLKCVVADPGTQASIRHTGYLESTGREWHSALSIEGITAKDYKSGTRPDQSQVPVWRRIVLIIRLLTSAIKISFRALYDIASYDLGFRFIALAKSKE